MNGFLEWIRKRAGDGAVVDEIDRDGCAVALDDTSAPTIILDMDSDALALPVGRKKCDFLLICGNTVDSWVVPIELKSGSLVVNPTIDQLQGGANVADAALPPDCSFRFAAVVAHGRHLRSRARRRLRAHEIRLRHRTCQPTLIPCYAQLAPVIGEDAIAPNEPPTDLP